MTLTLQVINSRCLNATFNSPRPNSLLVSNNRDVGRDDSAAAAAAAAAADDDVDDNGYKGTPHDLLRVTLKVT